MIVVAFLQNMWVCEPERYLDGLARHGEAFRQRAMIQFLFGGCLTGRRLKAAFGDLVKDIVWEEATREVAADSSTILPPQPHHIREVLERYQPDLVLTFGRVAGAAVAELWQGSLLPVPHPAARQKETVQKLSEAAWHVRLLLAQGNPRAKQPAATQAAANDL